MTSRPKYNQYLTSNRRQVPAGLAYILFMSILTLVWELALLSVILKALLIMLCTVSHSINTSTESKYTRIDTGLTRNTTINVYNSTNCP